MSSYKKYNENELLTLLKSGDEAAFSEIYLRFSPGLINFAASRLASLEEAKDIIHDVFVRLWQQKETIHIHTSIEAFLFTSVRYRMIDHIRRRARHSEYENMLKALSIQIGSDEPEIETIETRDLRNVLESNVDQLEPRARQIYEMSRQKNLSIQEIAQHLNISERTVKNQLTTALGHLRQVWNKLAIFLLFW